MHSDGVSVIPGDDPPQLDHLVEAYYSQRGNHFSVAAY